MKNLRALRLIGATGQLRTAMFQNREHFVVPVVALVEGVVHASNAEKPELVLASELRKFPLGWNGRPLCGSHPKDASGRPVSANDPRVLERDAFGQIFNAYVPEDRLLVEAFIDPAQVRSGTIAENVLRRLQANEPVEVSVGCFMEIEERQGSFKGEKYYGVWRNIVPDHLAMLDEGERGACNWEDGCGAMRSATYRVDPGGLVVVQAPQLRAAAAEEHEDMTTTAKPNLWERLLGIRTIRDAAMSDMDLRRELNQTLADTEPGFLGIAEVFPTEKQVIYAIQLSDSPTQLFRRNYSIRDGKVNVKDEREEVRLETQYVAAALAAAAAAGEPKVACGCKKTPAAGQTSEGETVVNKEQRINALIAASKGRLTEADRTWLNTVPEDRLSALESQEQPQQPAGTPQQQPQQQPGQPESTPAPGSTQVPGVPNPPVTPSQTNNDQARNASAKPTLEQFLASAPPEYAEQVRESLRQAEARKTATIAALKATGRCQFSDEELMTMSQSGLERLAALAAAPPPEISYVASAPVSRAAAQTIDGPPDFVATIRAARGQQVN